MSEPTTARAMAFRVEDMEREERVEALEQWGKAHREAGRAAERRAEVEHGPLAAPELEPTPEPGAEPFKPVWRDPPLTPKPEQPSSLVGRTRNEGVTMLALVNLAEAIEALTAEVRAARPDHNHIEIVALAERVESHVHDILRGDVEALHERLELLDTRTHSTNDRLDAALEDVARFVDELGALDAKVANLETKIAHLPFPAAPEPGA